MPRVPATPQQRWCRLGPGQRPPERGSERTSSGRRARIRVARGRGPDGPWPRAEGAIRCPRTRISPWPGSRSRRPRSHRRCRPRSCAARWPSPLWRWRWPRLLMPESYSWYAHTTSESAAQGVPWAWVARSGFFVFGLAVLGVAVRARRRWPPVGTAAHATFGLLMCLAGAFSSRSWEVAAVYDSVEDVLHSIAAPAWASPSCSVWWRQRGTASTHAPCPRDRRGGGRLRGGGATGHARRSPGGGCAPAGDVHDRVHLVRR
jgi:hypothetical protein